MGDPREHFRASPGSFRLVRAGRRPGPSMAISRRGKGVKDSVSVALCGGTAYMHGVSGQLGVFTGTCRLDRGGV